MQGTILIEAPASTPSAQFLLNALCQAKNIYDIVAACYHTIMQYQSRNEKKFIAEADYYMQYPPEQPFSRDLARFQSAVDALIYKMHTDSDSEEILDISEFIRILCEILRQVVYPEDIADGEYTSLLSYIIIETVDHHLQSKSQDDIFAYPEHCPLNTAVFTKECSVYFCETKSILRESYAPGCFRKPLHDYGIGSSFRSVLMFENNVLKAAVPKIKPVFISDECKYRLQSEHFLRIASIPFIGFDTFKIFEKGKMNPLGAKDAPKGEFYIGYQKDDEDANIKYVLQLLSLAIHNGSNIVVFPEFIMSSNMLSAVKDYLVANKRDNFNSQLVLVLAGTNYEYTGEGQGNNILHVYDRFGYELGRYYKYSPFLELCNEQIHGAFYGRDPSQGAPKGQQHIYNLEILSDPGKECTIFDVEEIGRILPAICRDAIDGTYTDILAKFFMPSLVLIPSWSRSLSSFQNCLSPIATNLHATSVVCDCCNAIDNHEQTIGMVVYPQKRKSQMHPKMLPLNRMGSCKKSCNVYEGCIHFVDLRFEKGELSATVSQLKGCALNQD